MVCANVFCTLPPSLYPHYFPVSCDSSCGQPLRACDIFFSVLQQLGHRRANDFGRPKYSRRLVPFASYLSSPARLLAQAIDDRILCYWMAPVCFAAAAHLFFVALGARPGASSRRRFLAPPVRTLQSVHTVEQPIIHRAPMAPPQAWPRLARRRPYSSLSSSSSSPSSSLLPPELDDESATGRRFGLTKSSSSSSSSSSLPPSLSLPRLAGLSPAAGSAGASGVSAANSAGLQLHPQLGTWIQISPVANAGLAGARHGERTTCWSPSGA